MKEACLYSLHNPDYGNWNSQVILNLVSFCSQWFQNQYKENPTADDRKRRFNSHNTVFLFALGNCFVVNNYKSLKHLPSIVLGLLKFAVVVLVWSENFIKSESNAIILRRGLAEL